MGAGPCGGGRMDCLCLIFSWFALQGKQRRTTLSVADDSVSERLVCECTMVNGAFIFFFTPSCVLQYLLECLWPYLLPMLVVRQGAFYVLVNHLRLKDKTGMFLRALLWKGLRALSGQRLADS